MSDMFSIDRFVDAPRALVFEVWSKAEHLARWFGPKGMEIPHCEVDFRVGGTFRVVMRGHGMESGFGGTYLEIVPDQRIHWTSRIDGLDQDIVTIAEFRDEKKGTRISVRQTIPANKDFAAGQRQGWTETLEKLDAHAAGLAGGDVIFVERTFDAPRSLMWAAWTEPSRFAQWFGPRGATMEVVALEMKPGGRIHFCHRFDGNEVWIAGTCDELVPPERLVFTIGFVDQRGTPIPHPMVPGWPADATITSHVTMSGDGNRTRVAIVQTIATASAGGRDGIRLHNSMAVEGWRQGLDRLAAFVS
jgi:uncharacterized protein YndB with AHSA1/START domain